MKLVGVEGDNLDNSTLMTNPEKTTPVYTATNLPNVLTIQGDNLHNKVFSSSPINFYLKGNLTQQRDDDLSNSNNVELSLNEIGNKAICDFYKNSNTDANLTCSLEVPTNTGVTNLTFKDNEVTIGNNSLYLNSLNKIQFTYNTQANSTEPEPSSTTGEVTGQRMYNRKKSNSHKAAVIVVSIIAGVVVLGGLIAAILYFSKFNKPKVVNINNSSDISPVDTRRNDSNVTNIDMIK